MKISAGILRLLFILCVPLALWQCDEDDKGTGQLRIELTDAPVDDDDVKAVFVTVAGVEIDGERWTGMDTKSTIDVMALQDGDLQLLGIGDENAKSYDRVKLILDLDEDANGGSPGCYVQTQDNAKHDLAATSAEELKIDISGPEFDVVNEGTSSIVVDFDLRKSLRYGNSNEPSSNYSFGTSGEMDAALRYVDKSKAGHVQGNCNDPVTPSEKIIVYAYHKGEFNRQDEISGPSDEQFDDAVTSAEVDGQGNYKLAWLEAGQYELVFASYEDDGNNGTMDLQGTLSLNSLLNLDLKAISVGASSTVTVDVLVTGILPL